MARVTVEDCLEQLPNRFSLVLIAAERTKQLIKGAEALIEDDRTNKEAVLALREIAAGVIRADMSQFDVNEGLRGFAGPMSREDLPPAAEDELPPAADDDFDLPPAADDDELPPKQTERHPMALKQENLHDVRMVRRHIGRGKIKRADWNKHVEDLPDIGEMAEESRVLFEHGGAERDGNRS